MVGFVEVPTKDIPIQAGSSLAYNPSAFFDVRNQKFKNVNGDLEDRVTALEGMHKIGIGLFLILGIGIVFIIKNKKWNYNKF